MPHTVVVDFAVALLLSSAVCDLLSQIAEEDELRIVAFWTLLFGAVAATFAAVSGYSAATAAAPTGLAEQVILTHRNLGIATAACFVPVAAWRTANAGRLPLRFAPLYWLLTAAGVALLVITAWYGGTAVFRHGVGVGIVR